MSHNSCETFVRASQDCDTFTRVSHDSRVIFVPASHDVCANFNQFYFLQLSLKMVLFMTHICRIVQISEMSLRCVCKRLRRVGDRFATYAMIWRLFCDDFCCTKKCYMFKTLVNHSRRVRDACRTLRYHANVSRQYAPVLRIDSQTHCELVTSQ